MDAGQTAAVTCYRHPNRETYVRCTRCSRPICPNCMNEASVGFQCPECVREGNKTIRQAKGAFGGGVVGKREYVTYSLIAINVAVFILGIVLAGSDAIIGGGSLFSGSTSTPVHLWGSILSYTTNFGDANGNLVSTETGVAQGAYYRLLTSEFLHFGIFHLLMNMWALWVIGRYIERIVGHWRFLAIYLVSGLGGSVLAYMISDPRGLTAGASGAIFGLFGAVFFVNRKLGRDISGVLIIIGINVAYSFMLRSQISIAGHIGGLVTGAVLALGVAYAPRKHRTIVQVGTFVVVLAILAVLVATRTQDLLNNPAPAYPVDA